MRNIDQCPQGLLYNSFSVILFQTFVTDQINKNLNQAISQLKAKGIDSIYLESGINNHQAHSFFEKFGFKHISNIFRMKLEQ